METLITLRNIEKSYGALHVLRDINLEIYRNEIVTVVGPSGAGKTTMLQIAGTLDHPDSGSVLYGGQDVTRLSDNDLSRFRNSQTGFVFQSHRLLPEFSAVENVALPAMIGGMSKRKATERAAELLDMLGLKERLNHRPSEMSGGECQRTAIARALVNKPDVIFADEPTGALDSANRDEICSIFTRLKEELGQTFVIVTHDPTITLIADRIVNMADGIITDISSCNNNY